MEVKTIQNENWVLHNDGKISIYNQDFSMIIKQLDLSINIESLNQISEYGSAVYFLETTDDGYRIYNLVQDELILVIEQSEDYASSSSLLFTSEDTYITSGQYQVEDISDHAFFRKYEIGKAFSPVRTDIKLNYFDVEYLHDTLIVDAPWDHYFYKINYAFQNNSTDLTNNVNLYAREIYNGVPVDFLYQNLYSDDIIPNELVNVEDTKIVSFRNSENIKVAIPGGAYKFNSDISFLVATLISSLSELENESLLKLGPNPFSTKLSVISDESIKRVEIYSRSGQLVHSVKGTSFTNINLEHLATGNYYLRATTEDYIYNQLIVKVE